MASRENDPSMPNALGEFRPHKPRAEPITTSGHQPGKPIGNNSAPEFHAQVLPPGSAEPKNTFKPNPVNETPGQPLNESSSRPNGKETTQTGALDMPGATSADVHTGLGKPYQGQTSAEIRHEGKHGRKREKAGGLGQHEGGSGLRGSVDTDIQRLQKDPATSSIPERHSNEG